MSEDDVNKAGNTPPDTRDQDAAEESLPAQVRRVLAENGIAQTQLARECGVHPKTLNAWLTETYQGRQETIAVPVKKWLDRRADRERTRAEMPAAPAFVETRFATECFRLFEHAQYLPDMVIVAGDAGVGKTTAIDAYAATRPNVWKITCETSMTTPRVLVEAVAERLGMSVSFSPGLRMSREVVRKIEGSGGLLVLDEAQFLPSNVLDQVRTFHDLGNIGIALVGNKQVYTRFEGGQRTAQYAQLFSRVGARTTRDRPYAADIDLLVDAWGIEGEAERDLLTVIATKPGGFRGLTKCLRIAHLMAAGEEAALCARHILAAWRQLGNDDPAKGRKAGA